MSYGTDSWCYDRIVSGRMATGIHVLAQACYRRLTTSRGTLDDGEEGSVYGLDVEDFIGRVGTDDATAALPPVVEAELLKDDRIDTVEVAASIVRSADGLDSITLEIDVFPRDESEAFALTLSVSAVTVALLGVSPL